MSTAPAKDTIYIDIDDEITAIIDKLQASQAKIVVLVLPKRATVLQSIVNMKLLKRAAKNANKNLVLITSEAGLLPLAGAAGVHVAKNLQSKPEIPSAPLVPDEEEELAANVPTTAGDEVDKTKPIGELATKNTTTQSEDTIEVDNNEPLAKAGTGASAAKTAKARKKDGKTKIPNFERFRKRLFLIGAAVIALLLLWFLAVFTLPKASITIKTDTTNQSAEVDFTASPSAQTVDEDSDTVPAKLAEQPKSESQKAPATGTKDVGTKATGTVTISNCTDAAITIPAGTAVSSNGLNFLTNNTLQLDEGNFSSGGVCKTNGDHIGSVGVTAQANGDQYNLSARSYTVAGQPANVKAAGTAMSGGSSKVIKVVTQADVDAAKAKFASNDEAAKQQLKKTLEGQNYFVIPDTFTVKDPQTTISPNVGEEGTEVTVSEKGTYTMIGVKEADLEKIIDQAVSSEIDTDQQQVQDYRLDNATFRVVKTEPNGNVVLTVNAEVAIGPKINQDELKKEIAGKKRGDTANVIKEIPGVKEVDVDYSPFWVTKTPKKQTKITFIFEKAN
jgi:hypothetical protein